MPATIAPPQQAKAPDLSALYAANMGMTSNTGTNLTGGTANNPTIQYQNLLG